MVIACSNEELLEKQGIIQEALKSAKQRNIDVKILLSTFVNKESLKEIKKYAQVKHYPDTKNRFVIGDNKELLMMLQNHTDTHPVYDTGIWINSEFFVNSLADMFSKTWSNSKLL